MKMRAKINKVRQVIHFTPFVKKLILILNHFGFALAVMVSARDFRLDSLVF